MGERLFIKEKYSKKDDNNDKKKGKSQQKTHGVDVLAIRCYHFKKESHIRKVCHDRKKKMVKRRIMIMQLLSKMDMNLLIRVVSCFWRPSVS